MMVVSWQTTRVTRLVFRFLVPFSFAFFPSAGSGQGCEELPLGTLAFSSIRDGNADLYLMNADGSDLHRVTEDPTEESEPAWSPDGRRLVFQSRRPHWRIFVLPFVGGPQQMVSPSLGWSPSWSPDGAWIVFADQQNLLRMTPDGDSLQGLISGGRHGRPSWSPDGGKIVLHSSRWGNPEVMVMRSDGSSLERLTAAPGRDIHATWSPDGTQIAFASDREGTLDIYLMAEDGSNLRRLTDASSQEMLPAWSPDGAWLAYVSDQAGNQDLYLMKVDGSCRKQLTTNPGTDSFPAWRPKASGILPERGRN